MDLPPPDPAKLLQSWMEWERGEATPGRVMANLKTGGLRQLLERLASPPAGPAPEAGGAGEGEPGGPAGGQPPSRAPVV
ncbi:MAG: hypothetical protein ACRDZX_16760 [Acidimicrobiales bacterium]